MAMPLLMLDLILLIWLLRRSLSDFIFVFSLVIFIFNLVNLALTLFTFILTLSTIVSTSLLTSITLIAYRAILFYRKVVKLLNMPIILLR